MFDCHTHSSFSGDSEMAADEACLKAINLGLKGIAFTDHLDIDYPNYDDTFDIDFGKYNDFMEKLKTQYYDNLTVLKGIEVGIQPHVITQSLEVIEAWNFDLVIASVHIIDGLDPYTGDFTRGKTQRAAYLRYLEEVHFALEKFNNFDVLGHIDYIKRYGEYHDKQLCYMDYRDILDLILKKLILNGKALEINAAGFRYGLENPLTDMEIIKRYRELGGEMVTTGSDAHSAEHVGHNFNFIKDILKASGFSHTVYFQERKPYFDKL